MKRAKQRPRGARLLPRRLADRVRAVRRAHKRQRQALQRDAHFVETARRVAVRLSPALQALAEERALDAMLDRMQRPGQLEAMQKAFAMSPAQMGEAAIEAAHRRRIRAELDAALAHGENDAVMRGLAQELDDDEFAALLAAERAKRGRNDGTTS